MSTLLGISLALFALAVVFITWAIFEARARRHEESAIIAFIGTIFALVSFILGAASG